MHDADVALVRHFLLVGADRAGSEAARSAVSAWEWLGPGVWLNVDESALLSEGRAFEAAEAALSELGPVISSEYLRENVPGSSSALDMSAASVRDELRKLKALLEDL